MDAPPPASKTPAETPRTILRADDVAFWSVVHHGAPKARRHAWVPDQASREAKYRAICGRAPGHAPALERFRSTRPGPKVCRHCARRVEPSPQAATPTIGWGLPTPPASEGATPTGAG